MIPEFPEFKKLELSDRADIERVTKNFPPYSDFNFTSMWCWDVRNEAKISKLNSNLILRFSDYKNGQPFYSFIGSRNISWCAKDLIIKCKKEKIELKLKLLPEVSIAGIDESIFSLGHDRNNFDYIYDVFKLSNYQGNLYSSHRSQINRFNRRYPNMKIKQIDLNNNQIQKEIVELSKIWEKNKIIQKKKVKIDNELEAINRFFLIDKKTNILGLGIFDNNKMIAFSIVEIIDSDFALGHFCKADSNYAGVYSYIMMEMAKIIYSHNVRLLNYEQDLGISNLRYSKKSFRPSYFLRKYTLTPKDNYLNKN